MENKYTAFFKGKQAVNIDFNAEKISKDAAILLSEKIERKDNIIKSISEQIQDKRNPNYIDFDVYNLLKQRVFLMIQGYADCNDVNSLKSDPIINQTLDGKMGSQPTLSRFENMIDKHSLYAMLKMWLSNYIDSIDKNRKQLIIDIDSTDDPTHGAQQLSMFNGYYCQFMYNELFFHDGLTGQIILPVLRPGNSHSNRWYVAILRRIITEIKLKRPDLEIIIRTDGGFSCPEFYRLAKKENLKYCTGIAANKVLKTKVTRVEKAIEILFRGTTQKYQHFIGPFEYQAGTWDEAQNCYAKVEYTGKGLNTRFFVSNFEEQTAREIYLDFYVKRGEASENRIKEVKNMCYSDRLSCHGYIANFFRLIISALSYQFFVVIKQMIAKTGHESAKKWNIDSIRLNLLKVVGIIKKTVKRINISYLKSFIYQDLYTELLLQ